MYVVECKAMTQFKPGVLGRIFAITKLVFPTTGVPMLAYGGTTSTTSNGVYQIAWPELATEEILSQLPKTYVIPKSTQKRRLNISAPQKTAKKWTKLRNDMLR